MQLGLIGCGKMGSALLRGILQNSASQIKGVSLFDVYSPAAQQLLEHCGDLATVESEVDQLVSKSDVVLLCVKPNDVKGVLHASAHWEGKLILSIAAGVKSTSLAAFSDFKARIIRVMPNTPALIGQGASAFCRGHQATDEDVSLASNLLGSVGIVEEVKESQMDAVTGLSGSGPAFIYTVIEALVDAGVKQGLARSTALSLATQTVKGAAGMVMESGTHPAVLRDQVTSPAGTTIAGVAELEAKGLRAALISAVDVATARSSELADS